MNLLKEKYLDFKELDRYKFTYLLEDGRRVSFVIYKKHFPHLIGLHKLTNIPLIARFNDKFDKSVKATNVLASIRDETELTDEIVKSSPHFLEIENRYNNFSRERILSLSFTEVIIDFDPTIIKTNLKSSYLFFERKDTGYLHLGIVLRNSEYVPETFFEESTDYYVKNQKTLKVKELCIHNAKGELILKEYPNGKQ